MYQNLQVRFNEIVLDINDTLIGMALDPRAMPGVATEVRSMRSSASTPSLRSRDGSITPMGRPDAPGGNVKVVVRVRGFLPRGMVLTDGDEALLTILNRNRKRCRMPD